MDGYTIGQLAKAAGVATSTVRFYERLGLIKADFRTGGNYRGYTPASVERLRFIRSATATGLSLQDVEALLKMTSAEEPPCDEVLTLMRKRLGEVRTRIDELRAVERVLVRSLGKCCQGAGDDLCVEVTRLGRVGGGRR